MPPNAPRESIPDLLRTSDVYKEHLPAIDHARHLIASHMSLVRQAISQVNRKRRDAWLPSLNAIDREQHVNCDGLQILFHNVGMEAYHKDNDDREVAELREPLRQIAATRLSIMQFEAKKAARMSVDGFSGPKNVKGIVSTIEELDAAVPAIAPFAEVPSLTPYLFKPQTAISQLRVMAGTQKFKDPDILLNLGSLYPDDLHILRSVCTALVNNGMCDQVQVVLENRAEELFGDKRALGVFLKQNPDLFSVFVTALVEGEQTAEAERWCNQSGFAELRGTDMKVTEKYLTALRHQGKFTEARRFLDSLRDKGVKHRVLDDQFQMVLAQNGSIFKGGQA